MIDPEVIKDIEHVSWMWPDAVHDRYELAVLEPGRRNYEQPCPCGCDTPPTKGTL